MNKILSIFRFVFILLFCSNIYADSENNSNDWGIPNPAEIQVKDKKFWFMEDKNTQLIHVVIGFKNSGSAYQSPDKISVPALCSFTMLCGVGKYSTMEFAAKCSELSLSVNTFTTMDNLYLVASMPVINRDAAIELLTEILSHPKFEEDEVKKAQQFAYSIQDYVDEPLNSIFSTLAPSIVFKGHPYVRGIYGTAENMLKLSTKDLRDFHDNFLTKNNCTCYIGGNISKENASKLFERILNALPNGTAKDDISDVVPKIDNSITKYYAEGTQTTIAFIVKSVPMSAENRYIARLLFRILGENNCFKGRILSVLRSEKGLIYSGGVRLVDSYHANYAIGYIRVDNKNVEEAIKATKAILSDLREHGISQEELEFAKSNYRGALATQLRSSEILSLFFFSNLMYNRPVTCLSDCLNGIEKVSLDDVNKLAKVLFEKVSFIVIGGK